MALTPEGVLYAYDDFFHALITIDTETGVGDLVSLLDIGPGQIYDADYHDGVIFFPMQAPQSNLTAIDLVTLEATIDQHFGATAPPGVAIAENLKLTGLFVHLGLFALVANDLDCFVFPEWYTIDIGGDPSALGELEWDSPNTVLYHLQFRGTQIVIREVDETTGQEEDVTNIQVPGMDIDSVAISTSGDVEPACLLIDADDDGDVDLEDYAAALACFTVLSTLAFWTFVREFSPLRPDRGGQSVGKDGARTCLSSGRRGWATCPRGYA